MVSVMVRQKAHFRIEIRDLINGKSKTLSLINHDKMNIDDIATILTECLNRTPKTI